MQDRSGDLTRSTGDKVAAPLPVAELSHEERVACLRLVRSDRVGPVTFRALINRCGGAEAALAALPELVRRGGSRSAPHVPSRAAAEAELEAAERCGATPIFTIEPGFPRMLVALDHPPPMIYACGRLELLNRTAIGIIGSRDASAAGMTLTRQIAGDLSRAGIVIVSGLARGIDRAAHETSLSAGTVAVLAGGIDIIYPPEHDVLQRAIAHEGCLVSERPPGCRPRGKDFPRRNRLISGLSLGVVIVEAAARSGSLITARFAAEQGREVLAVPGHPLDPRAAGTNRLIREGATLVTCGEDVLEAIRPIAGGARGFGSPAAADIWPGPDFDEAAPGTAAATSNANLHEPAADLRRRVLSVLGPAPAHADEIARAADVSARDLQIVLLELSLAGRIEHHGGQLISLRLANS